MAAPSMKRTQASSPIARNAPKVMNGSSQRAPSTSTSARPSIASTKPKLEVHPLGIGGKKDPARLVFNVPALATWLAAALG